MNRSELSAPAPLNVSHEVAAFDCGEAALNRWLAQQALKNEAGGASRTYVVCASDRVVGYYCLAAGAVVRDTAPKPMQRNMPDPIPVMVLGRLAVDRDYQHRGIGRALLRDAILRVLGVAESVGVKAMLVHALSDKAKGFYVAHGFRESPVEPMTLCLVLDSARQALSE